MKNGSAGGRETVKRHGRQHMQEIGRKGYQSTLNRYFAGDKLAFRAWLTARAWDRLASDLADVKIAQQLANGAATACVELVVMSDFDETPF